MKGASTDKEPLLLWWMPVVALTAPLAFAAWEGVNAASSPLREVAWALVWPGLLLYAGAVTLLWAGWKIELE